ncbi:hypothetical protein OROGR_003740 [Orobanche gracilis]
MALSDWSLRRTTCPGCGHGQVGKNVNANSHRCQNLGNGGKLFVRSDELRAELGC